MLRARHDNEAKTYRHGRCTLARGRRDRRSVAPLRRASSSLPAQYR